MTDPTYNRETINANPVWRLAFTLSEIQNDGAPTGWGRYIWVAECLLAAYTMAPKPPEPERRGAMVAPLATSPEVKPTLAERLKSPTLRAEIAKARERLDSEDAGACPACGEPMRHGKCPALAALDHNEKESK